MHVNPRECMFCRDGLPERPNEPANLAFLAHIDDRAECKDAFDAWTYHMQSDWVGD
ncbi:MAG: hypothetical protein ABR562_03750 [Thermoplasmatota archaeon]|nr:hypothetical protein [Halobacteriales archaeon]